MSEFDVNPVRVGMAVAAALAVLISLRARKRPRTTETDTGRRYRLPLVLPVLSLLLAVAGAVMMLDPFTTRIVATPAVPLAVGAFLVVLGGYHTVRGARFYLEPHADRIAFRQALGPRQVIRYDEIEGVDAFKQYDRDYLVITDAGGARLKIDLTIFTATPLVEFVEQLDAGSS